MTTGQGYGTSWGAGNWGSGLQNIQLITLTGIPTAETFGALFLAPGSNIVIGGIGSGEAFGALSVELGSDIVLGGIASGEVFGTTSVVAVVAPVGIGSAEAFGTASLASTVYPTGIGSAEAFGSARVARSMSPVGIGSAEAFGALALELGEDIVLGGIASREAFGALALSRDVLVGGITSAEAFGALSVAKVIRPLGIGSLEAFGLTVLTNSGIAPVGIGSEEAFGLLRLQDYGRLRVVNAPGGASGPIDGGTAVTLFGAVFNTEPCSDSFKSGVLLGGWSSSVTGSGQLLARADDLLFDTGSTPGSSVALTRVEAVGDVDASFDLTTVTVSGNGLATNVLFSSQLFADAGNNFTLALTSSAGRTFVRILAVASGSTVVNQVVPLIGGVGGGGIVTSRFIRVGARVLGFLNGAPYVDATWVALPSRLVYGISNDGGLASRVAASATDYRRQALVTFGGQPVVSYTLTSPALAVASTPPAAEPGVVDISATGCGPTETIQDGFTYTLGPRLVVQSAPYEAGGGAKTELAVLNDVTLGGGGV